MPMRFQRQWDFNPGNKALALNDLTQDREVMLALQEALTIALTGQAIDVPYTPVASGLQATNVQAAIDEQVSNFKDLTESLEGILGQAGLNAEGVMDLLGNGALVEGQNVSLTYDDAAGTLTLDVLMPGLDAEAVMDLLGTTGLVQGPGISLTYDDAAGTITVASAGVDAEAVRDTMAAALVQGPNISITVDDAANTITISGAASGLWKGAWSAAPEQLVWSQDMSTNLTPFTGEGVRTAMSSSVGTSKPGAYSWTDQGSGTADHGSTHNIAQLLISDIPAMAGRTPTRVKFWYASKSVAAAAIGRTNIVQIVKNGTVQFSDNLDTNGNTVERAWAEYDMPLTSLTDTVLLRLTDVNTTSFYPTGYIAVTGVRVYATDPSWTGYKIDETVTYLGKLWRSTSNNNLTTPGAVGASWAEVPLAGYTKAISSPTANYTLTGADAGTFIRMNVATANTLTVPPNSSVAFPIGTVIEGVQAGAGQTTITPGSGVTINASPGLKTAAQYATFGLLKTATDTWLAYGRLTA